MCRYYMSRSRRRSKVYRSRRKSHQRGHKRKTYRRKRVISKQARRSQKKQRKTRRMKRNLVGGAASAQSIPVKYWWGSRTGGSWHGTHLTVYENGQITLPPLTTKWGLMTYTQREIVLGPTDYVQGKLKHKRSRGTDYQIRLNVVPTAELTGNKMILDMLTQKNYTEFIEVLEKINGLKQCLTQLHDTIRTSLSSLTERLGSGLDGEICVMEPATVVTIFNAFQRVQEAAATLSLTESVAARLFESVTPPSSQVFKSYTVKRLKREYTDLADREAAIANIEKEFNIMKWLKQYNHPYSRHFLCPVAYLPRKGFIMERGGHSLQFFFNQDQKHKLTKHTVPRLALGLARAVSFLHGIYSSGGDPCISYSHLDLKPDNILLEYGVDELPVTGLEDKVRLIDFGLASRSNVVPNATPPDTLHTDGCDTHESKVVPFDFGQGTQYYMAPEVLGKSVHGQIVYDYGQKADMFSYGVIVLELMGKQNIRVFGPDRGLTADTRRWGTNIETVIDPVFRQSSPVLKDIVEKCLSQTQDERYTAREVDTRMSEDLGRSVSEIGETLVTTTTSGAATTTASTEEPEPEPGYQSLS